jgi:hypothetical protein
MAFNNISKLKNKAVSQEYKLKKQKEFLSEFRALASTDVMSMFEQTSTSKLNADVSEWQVFVVVIWQYQILRQDM